MLRLALAYLVALAPALVLLTGLILVIEMTYHLSVKASEGTMISIFHVTVDTAAARSWAVAAVCVAGGFFLFRLTWPVVGAAWDDALAHVHGAEQMK
jgi:branched-chain amino acid transport system permease protein